VTRESFVNPLLAASALALFAGGGCVAALVFQALPSPVLLPNSQENDGSTAIAFLVFVLPFSLWFLLYWKRRTGLAVALTMFSAGFGIGSLLWGA
jgi:hypothetical protein